MEQTLVLAKPDGVCKRHVGDIIQRFERQKLTLSGMKMIRLSEADAKRFYQEHDGKPFFPGLLQFMTSAPIVAMVWKGDNAVQRARALMGKTNSTEADPGTLRRDFGTNNRYNLVHGSDSTTSAAREIAFFFKPEELFEYQEADWDSVPVR